MVMFCETCECVWTDDNPYCPVCMNIGVESGYEHLGGQDRKEIMQQALGKKRQVWRENEPAPRDFYKPTDMKPVAVTSQGFLNDSKKKQIEERWEHAGTLTLDDVDFAPAEKK